MAGAGSIQFEPNCIVSPGKPSIIPIRWAWLCHAKRETRVDARYLSMHQWQLNMGPE